MLSTRYERLLELATAIKHQFEAKATHLRSSTKARSFETRRKSDDPSHIQARRRWHPPTTRAFQNRARKRSFGECLL